jgi:hypothetical protein
MFAVQRKAGTMIDVLATGFGVATVLLSLSVFFLVRSVIGTTPVLLEMGKAQVSSERNQLEAEKQRDAALAAQSKAEGDGKLATDRIAELGVELAAANKLLADLRAKGIDNATGDDLLAVSHGVLGHVPTTGAPGDASAGNDPAQAAAVPRPGSAGVG